MDSRELDAFALERDTTLAETDLAAAEVLEEVFVQVVIGLLHIAIHGYPQVIRSTRGSRNELLRRHSGNADAAASEAAEGGDEYVEQAKGQLLRLLPYIGLPSSLIYPMWRELRQACLIAAVYGHDLLRQDVQARILMATAGFRGLPAAEAKLEKAAQKLWQRIASASTRRIQVGKAAVQLMELAERVTDSVLQEFRSGPGVTPEEYAKVLDPEPTPSDVARALQASGKQTLADVVRWSVQSSRHSDL